VDHRIVENTTELGELRSAINALIVHIGAASNAFTADRKRAVDQRVALAGDAQLGMGLLERMRALGGLTSDNGYALAAEWAMRIFLIAIDSLPVMVKFLTGFTTYDAIVADRLARQLRDQQAINDTQRWQVGMEQDLRRFEITQNLAAQRQRIHLEARLASLHHEARRESITDYRAAYLLNEQSTSYLSHVDLYDEAATEDNTRPHAPPDQRRSPAGDAEH
jgi:hypothetical protein